jgi:hypothetical protein
LRTPFSADTEHPAPYAPPYSLILECKTVLDNNEPRTNNFDVSVWVKWGIYTPATLKLTYDGKVVTSF